METFVSAVKSLLLSWYQITVDNFDYFIAVASLTGLLLCWLVSLCFRSRWGTQKQYFEKQQKALYQEYDITWHGLESATHQVQQLKEELLIKDSHIDQITKDSQANQIMAKRAVDLDAQLARRNNELSQLVSMLEAESGIGGQLPAIDGLDSDALWQRHVEAAKQLAERMRHNQQLASELQQTQQGLSTQIAEQQADILDLQQSLTAKDGQIGQLTDEIETQKALASDKLSHIQEDLSAQIAEQQAAIQNLQQVLTARDSQISELTEEVESQKTIALNEFNQTQQDLSAQIAAQQIAIKDLQGALTAKDSQIGQLTADLENQKSIAKQELAKAPALLAGKEKAVVTEQIQQADKNSGASFDSVAKVTKTVDVDAKQNSVDVNVAKPTVAESVQKVSVAETVAKQRAAANTIVEKPGANVKSNTKLEKKSWLTTLKSKLKTSESPKGKSVAPTESIGAEAVAVTVLEPAKEILQEAASVVELKASESAISSDSAANAGVGVETTTSELSSQTAALAAQEAESVDAISTVETVAKQQAPENTIVENPSVSVKSSAKPEKKSWLTTLKSKLKTSEAPKGKPVASAESVGTEAVAATVLEPAKEILQEAASVVELKVSESTISSDSAANAEVGVETTTSELSSQTAALTAQETESVDAISTVQAVVQPDENLPASSEVSDKTVAITELPSKPLAKKKSWFSPISAQFSTLVGKDKQTKETPKQPDIEQAVENITAASTEQVLTPETLVTEITVDILQDVDAAGTATNNNPVAEESVTAVEVSPVSEAVETVNAEGYPITGKKSWISTITKQLKFSQGSNKSNSKPVNLEPETLTDSLSSVGGVDETVDQAELPNESLTQEISSTDGLRELVVEEGTSNSESIIALDVVEASDQENVDDSTRESAKRLEKSELVQEEIWAEVITGNSEAAETEVEENSIVDSIIDVLGLTEEAPVDSIHMNYVRTLDDIAIGSTSGQAESESSVDVSDIVEISHGAAETSEAGNAEVATDSSEAESSEVVAENELAGEGSTVDLIIDVLELTEEAPVDSVHMNYVRTLDDIAIGSASGQAESESSVDVSEAVEVGGNVVQSVEIGQSEAETSETENAEVAAYSSKAEGSGVVAENELAGEGSTVDLIIDVLGLTEEAPVDSIHMNYVRTLDDIAIGSTSGQVESKLPVEDSDVVDVNGGVHDVAETSETENTEATTDSVEAESSGVVAENELAGESFTVDLIVDVLGVAEEAQVDSIHMDYVRTLDDIAIGSTSGQAGSESSVAVSDVVEISQGAAETSEAENAEVAADSPEAEGSGVVAENELARESFTVDLIVDVLGVAEEAPIDSIHMNYVRTLDDIAIGSTSGQAESESSVAVSDVVEISQGAAETSEAENAEVAADSPEAEGSGVVAENELAGEGSTVDLIIDVLGLAEEEAPVDSIHMDYVRTLDDIAIGSISGQVESESSVAVSDVVEISQSAAETNEAENAEVVTDRSETERFGVTEAAPIDSIHMDYVRTLDDIAIGSSSGQAESESSIDVSDVVEISQSAAETSEVENVEVVTDHSETERFGVTEAAPIDSIHMNYVRTLDDIAIAPKPVKVETESFADISQEVGARLLDDDSEQMNAAEVAQFLEASESTAIDGISIADVLGLSEDVPEEPVYMDYVRTLDDIAIAVVPKATVNAQLSAETAADGVDDRYSGNTANLDGEITPEFITAETKIGEQAKLEPIYMDYVRSFEDIAVSSTNNLAQVAAGEQDLKEDNLENREGHVFQEPQIANQGSWLNVIKGLIGVDTASQSELVYMDYVRSMDDISLSDRKSENKAQEEEIPEVAKVENASLLGSFKRLFGLNQRS